MFRGLFFIVFIINIRTSSCVIEALYEAGQQVWKLYTIIDNRELNISRAAKATERLSDNSIIQELAKQLDDIQENLNELEEFMGPKEIWRIIKSWPLDASTIRGIETIELFVEMIDQCYEQFNDYRDENYRSHDSFEYLMRDVFLNLEGYIIVIRKFATNEEKSVSNEKNLVATIANFTKAHGAEMCGAPQLISNIIIQLFRMIIIAELKTSTMLAHENIYAYVRSKDKQERQRINSLARNELEKQFAIYINMFSLNMIVIDRSYSRACDPPSGDWTRDQSFYELEKTFQAIIFRYDQHNCRTESCNYINNEKTYRCRPLFSPEPVFEGPEDTVTECAYLYRIKACVLKNGPYTYQYVQSAQLGFLGRNTSCPEDNGEVIETIKTSLIKYAACACNFYRSHNKISLLMIESDVDSNRVIIGLRFVRRNKVLYIQSKQGELGRNGNINEYSQSWIAIPENVNYSLTEPINKENRVFFLDDVTLPTSFVLTGVKFRKVTRGSLSGFAIAIYGTSFNYRTGKLILEGDSRRSRQEWSPTPGKSLSFTPVSSAFTTLPHTVTSSDTKYVSLERSALKEDFGQSTLPLFDAIPITFEVPSPLGGVGMFHKGVEGYAGLFSLRVYGIQYEKYFYDFKLGHMINDTVLFNCSFH